MATSVAVRDIGRSCRHCGALLPTIKRAVQTGRTSDVRRRLMLQQVPRVTLNSITASMQGRLLDITRPPTITAQTSTRSSKQHPHPKFGFQNAYTRELSLNLDWNFEARDHCGCVQKRLKRFSRSEKPPRAAPGGCCR